VLAADKLVQSPRLYATFLLWLLSELFEELPEVGDLDKPKLVFFFDEAHLLFRDAPKALIDKVETVVRLIRSKGVGVYFVTQNPLDLPATVLGQLGNRIQHALRAFTPAEQKAVRAAAETFRPNPKLRVEDAIGQLAVGEALVSTLQADGTPTPVERARICPPRSRIGAITAEERRVVIERSPLAGRYDEEVDRESAYELLTGRATTVAADPRPHTAGGGEAAPVRNDNPWGGRAGPAAPRTGAGPSSGKGRIPDVTPRGGPMAPGPMRRIPAPAQQRQAPPPASDGGGGGLGGILGGILTGNRGRREGAVEAMAKSAARSVGSAVGRQISNAVLRGVLGSILRR
jgi:hypothetical protein